MKINEKSQSHSDWVQARPQTVWLTGVICKLPSEMSSLSAFSEIWSLSDGRQAVNHLPISKSHQITLLESLKLIGWEAGEDAKCRQGTYRTSWSEDNVISPAIPHIDFEAESVVNVDIIFSTGDVVVSCRETTHNNRTLCVGNNKSIRPYLIM